MGLDGFVRCRCLQDGRVTPPAELGELVVDEDGYLDVADREKSLALDRWLHSACPHEDMEFVNVRVGRLGGLPQLLEQRRFPVLHAVLPEANGGTAPASAGPAALAELDVLLRLPDVGEEALLCDADTGEVVWRGTHSGGANVMTRGIHLGVDLDGFFIRRAGEGGDELFRALRFAQEVVSPGGRGEYPTVRFADGARELTLAVDPVTSGAPGSPHPANLETRTRRRTPAEYRGVMAALRRLFEASVETGNPVVWC